MNADDVFPGEQRKREREGEREREREGERERERERTVYTREHVLIGWNILFDFIQSTNRPAAVLNDSNMYKYCVFVGDHLFSLIMDCE